MPLIVRWYVRTALLHLLAACLVGAAVLAGPPLGASWLAGLLRVPFYHLLMVGWATQLIAGVAIWMFPVLSRERPRGDERIAWAAYVALNLGLVLRVLAEPAQAATGAPWAGPALVAAAVLQTVAVWLIVVALWPRVRARPQRPAR